MAIKTTETKFSGISKDYDLRLDSKFYLFVNKNGFKFLKSASKTFIKLKSLLNLEYIPFEYEDDKKYKGLQTAKGYVDEEGNIIDYFEATKEKHPKRLKFTAQEGQIIISSLKGAKIPTFKIKKDSEGFVLSNGFHIFRFVGKTFNEDFVYYILKSKELRKILDNNLSRGIGISTYKERDLLRIEIPEISTKKQEVVVKELEKIEGQISELKKRIPNTQDIIENVFSEFLGYLHSKEYIKKKTEFFNISFKEIGTKKNLRCGASYHLFWRNYDGLILGTKRNYGTVKLKELMKHDSSAILKKGILDEKRILIDKEEVEAKTGIIKEEAFVEKIDSDKIIFGDADILISKLRPYLGHVILNDKKKPYMGTTEFMPFIVNKKEANELFLKYLFLSKIFLELSTFLMAGKEHPRITPYELLILKIPKPLLDIQNKAMELMNEKLGNMKQKKEDLRQLRSELNTALINSLT
jgi:restriction endonuclease S subunit